MVYSHSATLDKAIVKEKKLDVSLLRTGNV